MSNPQCPGLRSLYHAAKLRQLRAIAADPNTAPARVREVTLEITKLAEPLYIGPEAGPSSLIARLEREGIEAVERRTAEVWDAACRNEPVPAANDDAERTLAGRTDAPAGQRRILQPPPLKIDDLLFPEGRRMLPRCRLERRLVWNLLADLADAGFHPLSVLSDDDIETTTPIAVMEEVFNLDDATVFFTGDNWVRLVFGNDGYDAVSDWGYQAFSPLGEKFNDILNAFDGEVFA